MSDFVFDIGGVDAGGCREFSFGSPSVSTGQAGRVILASVLLFLLSTCATCSEIRYALYGHTVQAHVTNTYTSRTGRSGEMLNVRFRFLDTDGTEQIESLNVPVGQQAAFVKGSNIDVQFIPLRPVAARQCGSSACWAALPLVVTTVGGCHAVWQCLEEFKGYKAREAKSLTRSCP
jgi:hypothetical protein